MSLALCTQEMRQVRHHDALLDIRVWRWQDLAVGPSQRPDGAVNEGIWYMVHLPTGASAPWWWETGEAAAAAMIEISRLRNWWGDMTPADLAELGPQMWEIAERHGAERRRRGSPIAPRDQAPTLNGYGQ